MQDRASLCRRSGKSQVVPRPVPISAESRDTKDRKSWPFRLAVSENGGVNVLGSWSWMLGGLVHLPGFPHGSAGKLTVECCLSSCLQFWQLYNAVTLFELSSHEECKEWQVPRLHGSVCLSVGRWELEEGWAALRRTLLIPCFLLLGHERK